MVETATVALRTQLESSIAARDRAGAVSAVLDAVHEGRVPLDAVYRDVLTPLLVDVGTSWQEGTTRVWEEHFATSIVRTIIEALSIDVAKVAADLPALGHTAVLACPTGEQHDLGLRMLADRLTLLGWKAYFLGAETPAEEVVAAARELGADLVALSAATHYNLVLLRSFVDLVKRDLPGIRVGVGGPAFACDHRWPSGDLLDPRELGLDDNPAGACALPDSTG